MPISNQQRNAIEHHGLYLVPKETKEAPVNPANIVYRIVAVGAALFLAITVG